jgi:hypothetical protein
MQCLVGLPSMHEDSVRWGWDLEEEACCLVCAVGLPWLVTRSILHQDLDAVGFAGLQSDLVGLGAPVLASYPVGW